MLSYSVKKVLRNSLKLLIQKLLSALPQSSQTLLPWPRPSSMTLVLSWRHCCSVRGWVPFLTVATRELKAQFLAHVYHIADILPVFSTALLPSLILFFLLLLSLQHLSFILKFSSSDRKTSAYNVGDLGSIPGSGRSLEKEMQPTPIFMPGKSYGPRSLVGSSPGGHKESDTTEQLYFPSCMFESTALNSF